MRSALCPADPCMQHTAQPEVPCLHIRYTDQGVCTQPMHLKVGHVVLIVAAVPLVLCSCSHVYTLRQNLDDNDIVIFMTPLVSKVTHLTQQSHSPSEVETACTSCSSRQSPSACTHFLTSTCIDGGQHMPGPLSGALHSTCSSAHKGCPCPCYTVLRADPCH
jgi:hypothetical protein